MFELFVYLCRYIFIFYMIYFLYQGIIFHLNERKIYTNKKPDMILIKQRVIIIIFHITSFFILSYRTVNNNFNLNTLFIGFASLIFIICGLFFTLKIYIKSCPIIWNCIFFLIDIGFVILQRLNPELAQKQILWLFIGCGFSFFLPVLFKFLPKLNLFKYVYLGVGLALLFMTLSFGIEEGGALNWLRIKNIVFQPSEAVKLFFVFYLSSAFYKKPTIKKLILPTVMSALFILCLVFQTDLGSALIFFMTFMVMFYISTSNSILFFSGFLLASIASFFAYKIFPHVRTRVSIWQNPWKDVDHGGYQIVQSLFAIGTYGFFGCGLTKGFSGFIPVVEKDFIFAAICEEFGVIFAIGVIIIFIMLFFRCVEISLKNKNKFLILLSSGFTSLICFQTFLIIGGVIKFIPLTGVTLPFISYGGTSILINFTIIGIIQWICTLNNTK